MSTSVRPTVGVPRWPARVPVQMTVSGRPIGQISSHLSSCHAAFDKYRLISSITDGACSMCCLIAYAPPMLECLGL